MIFKISVLTFTLALASLDAVTATYVPKNDTVDQLNKRDDVGVGVVKMFIMSHDDWPTK